MTYEEQEYINSLTRERRERACHLTRERRERACRQAWMKQMAIQWGGWLVAGLILAANLVVAVH